MYSIEQIVAAFEMLPNWDEKYQFLTDIGNKLPPLAPEHQIEPNIVPGCMSRVWVIGELNEDGSVHLQADCDTPVVKGLVAMLVVTFDGKTAQQIIDFDVDALFKTLGLDENLSPNRHVGMYAMVKKIREIATTLAANQ